MAGNLETSIDTGLAVLVRVMPAFAGLSRRLAAIVMSGLAPRSPGG